MRIVTWNCNGALRRKTAEADALGADILVVQECEDPASSTPTYRAWARNHVWSGQLKSRGIGIFARNGHTIEALDWDSGGLSEFLPAMVDRSLGILGVWTQKSEPASASYIGQFWHYLQRHRQALDGRFLICGDFNSNTVWDRPKRKWNHSTCVEELRELGFESLYHRATGEAQGAESAATFYLYRHADKPFHLDYVFAHEALRGPDQFHLEVGDPQDWLRLSDHLPIIVDIRP